MAPVAFEATQLNGLRQLRQGAPGQQSVLRMCVAKTAPCQHRAKSLGMKMMRGRIFTAHFGIHYVYAEG